jgi:CubicO group peptidase (beta-lactamase class C family)
MAAPQSATGHVLTEQALSDYLNYLSARFVDSGAPGLAIVIVQGEDQAATHHLQGVGNVLADGPLEATTPLPLGTVTRALTGLLGLGLRHQELADLDQPLIGLELTDPQAAQQLTLRHLLSETGGIPSYTDSILSPQWADPADVFTVMEQAPILAKPGRLFEPSLLSVSAAGYMLGQTALGTGDLVQDYARAMQRTLFDPMGLLQATFAPPGGAAYGHLPSGAPANFEAVEPAAAGSDPYLPARGLYFSAVDLGRWLATELRSGAVEPVYGASGATQLAPKEAFLKRWYDSGPSRAADASPSMGWQVRYHQGTEWLALEGSGSGFYWQIGLIRAQGLAFACFVNAQTEVAKALTASVAPSLVEATRQPVARPVNPGRPGLNMMIDQKAPSPLAQPSENR